MERPRTSPTLMPPQSQAGERMFARPHPTVVPPSVLSRAARAKANERNRERRSRQIEEPLSRLRSVAHASCFRVARNRGLIRSRASSAAVRSASTFRPRHRCRHHARRLPSWIIHQLPRLLDRGQPKICRRSHRPIARGPLPLPVLRRPATRKVACCVRILRSTFLSPDRA
jgi:hypothetical protein